MRKFEHIDAIETIWAQKFIDELGFSLKDNKYLLAPEKVWDGGIYFKYFHKGFALAVVDYIAKEKIEFIKKPAENIDFYYIMYDLSEGKNQHTIDSKPYEMGKNSDFNFGFLEGNTERRVIPEIGKRTFSFRILVSKTFFNELLKEYSSGAFNDILQENLVKHLHFYGYADSKSKILLEQLTRRRLGDNNYELLALSLAHKILGNFMKSLVKTNTFIMKHSKADHDAIIHIKKYLDENLTSLFEGIDALASKAGMSASKFKLLFKEMYGITPANYHKTEKLKLAKAILESNNYSTVTDLAYEFNYHKPSYFISVFKKEFGFTPHELIRNDK